MPLDSCGVRIEIKAGILQFAITKYNLNIDAYYSKIGQICILDSLIYEMYFGTFLVITAIHVTIWSIRCQRYVTELWLTMHPTLHSRHRLLCYPIHLLLLIAARLNRIFPSWANHPRYMHIMIFKAYFMSYNLRLQNYYTHKQQHWFNRVVKKIQIFLAVLF